MMMEEGTYEAAMAALLGPTHQAQTAAQVSAAAQRRTRTIADMREYMQRLRLLDGDDATCRSRLPRRVIHVAGTKGKGSTAILCEAICRHRYGLQAGLFTSPHLMDLRERIRINGRPVGKAVFTQAYWEVRRRLVAGAATSDYDPTLPVLPGYFRMLTLIGLFCFGHHAQPRIDVMILEVGLGGRYDATNLLDRDEFVTAAGVTLLDYDHVRVLGHKLEQIAWEKAGIFQVRKGVDGPQSARPFEDSANPTHAARKGTTGACTHTPSSTVFALDSNTPQAVDTLRTCAQVEGEGAQLVLVGSSVARYRIPDEVTLGLAGRHQRENAALAVALCTELVRLCQGAGNHQIVVDHGVDAMYAGLSQVSWPARCQTVASTSECPHTFRLDGAHTIQSVQSGLEWFRTVRDATRSAVLVFNCSHERDPVELLSLLEDAALFTHVSFCPSDSTRPSMVAKQNARQYLVANNIPIVEEWLASSTTTTPSWQETLLSIWKHLDRSKKTSAVCSSSAANVLSDLGHPGCEVFVTGSLYLVGSVLNVLNWYEQEAEGALVI
jgi:folylpolyglutamate synthase